MKFKLITFLLIVHFLKQLVWLGLIPVWHFPDEEQHFAQTAFWAQKDRNPQGELDINREIDLSSEILGTKRDKRGINKFTYHPEHQVAYTKNQIGLYEEKIKSLNTRENRDKMVKREAAGYGPVYYILGAAVYKVFYKSDLFVRVFAARFVSVFLSMLTVYIVYLISKEVFKNKFLSFALTFLVAFQPMFSFVSSGVNSDNLFNLIFSLVLYSCLKIFYSKDIDLKYLLLLFASLMLGFNTKRQIYIAFPVISFAFLLFFFIKKKKEVMKKSNLPAIAAAGLIVGFFLLTTRGRIKIPEYTPGSFSLLKETFSQYIYWHLRHTIAETIPWYWGVFNWLGVALPRWLNRIQSRILILAALGLMIYLFKQAKLRKLTSKNNLRIFFLLGSALIYYLCIIFWDYFFRQSHSFSFGIQGRYFFPTIISHMLFIILGLFALIPEKLKTYFIKILVFWWAVFSLIGLHTAASSYYQLWPIDVFVNQVSQYKPMIFKAVGFSAVTLIFFVSFFALMFKVFQLDEKKSYKNH